MSNTKLDYLENMNLYESNATILEVQKNDAGTPVLILDKTIFYPQGGGQRCDTGRIKSETFEFIVNSVNYADGLVLHGGTIIKGTPEIGMEVNLTVDKERRDYNSRLQSGGHLILNAMLDAGQKLIAQKGYHFPDGPYVEFSGTIPEEEKQSLIAKLQTDIERLIELDLPIVAQIVSSDKLHEMCKNVPLNVPMDKPTRVVTIDGLSQPCGGTHVNSTGALKGMKIEKVRSKKGDTRISYAI